MSDRSKVHHLRPAPGAKTAKTRVGRGEGPRARPPVAAPRAPRPATRCRPRFEGGQMPLHMRLPKLRGFKNPFRVEYQVVNLDRLGRAVPRGRRRRPSTTWSPRVRSARPAGQGARQRRHRASRVQVSAHAFSGSAKEKIAAAGGTATEL